MTRLARTKGDLSHMEKKTKIIIGATAAVLLGIVMKGKAKTIQQSVNVDFNRYVSKTIEFEGGLTNDPNDLGGLTKYGIAKKYYPRLDIENLTIDDAKRIYYNDYYLPTKTPSVSKHIQFLFFDSCVTPGRTWATKTLQKLGGVKQDGILGPLTAAASKNVSLQAFTAARWAHYQQRAIDRPADKTHLAGWKSRCEKSLNAQLQFNQV